MVLLWNCIKKAVCSPEKSVSGQVLCFVLRNVFFVIVVFGFLVRPNYVVCSVVFVTVYWEVTSEFRMAYGVDLQIKNKTEKQPSSRLTVFIIWESELLLILRAPNEDYICICKIWILLMLPKLSINFYCTIYVSSAKKPFSISLAAHRKFSEGFFWICFFPFANTVVLIKAWMNLVPFFFLKS